MKHKSTKYKPSGDPKGFVIEFKPTELAAVYTVLGHIQSNHLEETLHGIDDTVLFNLVADLGNIGNADYEAGWDELVMSNTKKWIPVERASEFAPVPEDTQP